MPPLTLKVLASLLQVHGPDAALTSDHQGIDFLLASVREDLDQQANMQDLRERLAWYARARGEYRKLYLENYNRRYDRMNPPPPPYDRMIYEQKPGGDGPSAQDRKLERSPERSDRKKGK